MIRIVSPRKSWSFSIVAGCKATTELSSLTVSSTISLFAAFFRSKIAVEKSFLEFFLQKKIKRNCESNCKSYQIDTEFRMWRRRKLTSQMTQPGETFSRNRSRSAQREMGKKNWKIRVDIFFYWELFSGALYKREFFLFFFFFFLFLGYLCVLGKVTITKIYLNLDY